jgi:curved DNA-binding protein CbpA
MSTIDWYDVLLVERDCTNNDIKNSYRELVKTYHPDKKGGDPEMFELVTHAYNVLINPQTRASYDKLYSISKRSESSHFDLKSKSEQYFDSLKNTSVKKTKEEVSIDFDTIFAEMDKKYGLKRDENNKLVHKNSGDIYKKVEDLESIREHDDIENIPEKLFDNTDKIDLQKFNSIFDSMHRKHTDLIKHDGNPLAYNVSNEFGSYSSIDNYESLFVEDDNNLGNNLFGSVKMCDSNMPNKKLTKRDLEKHGNKADYVNSHNYKGENNTKTLEDKIKERELQTMQYDQRTIEDYNDNNDCGGYGIFKDLDITFDEFTDGNMIDEGGDFRSRYNKLIETRK